MGDQDRRRSSIFRRLSLLGRRSSNNSSAVWEVRSEDDLGLDMSPVKNKQERRRPRTLEKPAAPSAIQLPEEPQTIEPLGSTGESTALVRINGSTYSVATTRSQGSQYSATSSGERPRPRTLDGSIPPLSPLTATPSVPSMTSSERSARRKSSNVIQLVPKSMLSNMTGQPNQPNNQSEGLRKLERELQVLGAQERRARTESSQGGEGDPSPQRPTSRNYSESSDHRSSRSDASPSQAGKIRIQYVPRRSISLDEPETNVTAVNLIPSPVVNSNSSSAPSSSFRESPTRRINRSLTAVTEETRNNSEYHSDIEEGEEEDEGRTQDASEVERKEDES